MRVLVVDDHPLFRDGVASLLRAHGVEVMEAGDGCEAQTQVQAQRPDVILMDIKMPRCDGLEATRIIKAQNPDIKIVMLTASEDETDLFEAVKSGAEGYLLKDLEATQLLELLYGVLRGEPAITPSTAAKILEEFSRQQRQQGGSSVGEDLTAREIEVLRLLVDGAANKDIAASLYISENTVKFHLSRILRKLHLRNRSQVVAYALRHGLIREKKPQA